MSDAATITNLATRAKRLSALARARRANEKDAQDLGQVQTALNKLDLELLKLSEVLGTRRRLMDVGVPVAEVQALTRAPKRLQEQIDTVGRPTAQFLNARIRDVTDSRTATDDANGQAWRMWAGNRIEELPVALLPRVPFHRRAETDRRIIALKKLAAGAPRSADIIQFQQSYGLVEAELNSVEAATIDAVLKRFTSGQIRLADLSDLELQMLRDDATLADQLFLHLSS